MPDHAKYIAARVVTGLLYAGMLACLSAVIAHEVRLAQLEAVLEELTPEVSRQSRE